MSALTGENPIEPNTPWFSIIDPSMAFVFSIGDIPIRFYKGSPDEPTTRTLATHQLESTQLSLAFSDIDTSPVVLWRFAVDTHANASVMTISLVGFDENDSAVCVWSYDEGHQAHQVDDGETSGNSNSANEPVELEPASAQVKGKSSNESGVQS